MSDLARALLDELAGDPVALDRLADVLVERVAARVGSGVPVAVGDRRGRYLACPLSRIRKLTDDRGPSRATTTAAACCTAATSWTRSFGRVVPCAPKYAEGVLTAKERPAPLERPGRRHPD